MSDFKLVDENLIHRVFIRSWRPGDGLVCTHAKVAPRDLPCSEPVAVVLSEEKREPLGRYGRRAGTQRVVCRNHAPGLARPHQLNADAKTAASERLIVEHWETYQRYIEEELAARTAAALEFADPEVRRIVLGGAA